MQLNQKSTAMITNKMMDQNYFTDDIQELANFINSNFDNIEVSVNQPFDTAEFHNLFVINQPDED